MKLKHKIGITSLFAFLVLSGPVAQAFAPGNSGVLGGGACSTCAGVTSTSTGEAGSGGSITAENSPLSNQIRAATGSASGVEYSRAGEHYTAVQFVGESQQSTTQESENQVYTNQ